MNQYWQAAKCTHLDPRLAAESAECWLSGWKGCTVPIFCCTGPAPTGSPHQPAGAILASSRQDQTTHACLRCQHHSHSQGCLSSLVSHIPPPLFKFPPLSPCVVCRPPALDQVCSHIHNCSCFSVFFLGWQLVMQELAGQLCSDPRSIVTLAVLSQYRHTLMYQKSFIIEALFKKFSSRLSPYRHVSDLAARKKGILERCLCRYTCLYHVHLPIVDVDDKLWCRMWVWQACCPCSQPSCCTLLHPVALPAASQITLPSHTTSAQWQKQSSGPLSHSSHSVLRTACCLCSNAGSLTHLPCL